MNEYPKALYLHGWEDLSAYVIVQDREGEAKAREDGYAMLNEEPAKPRRGRPRKEQ